MKIGRNESCPCGSGKKYKKCCLDKSDEQRLAEAVLRSSENLKNEAHIKQCLHPNLKIGIKLRDYKIKIKCLSRCKNFGRHFLS